MPTRIYAFAKELGLDNKALLDICEKASIKGKGSALASLDDTEISQIKAFMAGGSNTAEAPAEPETGAPVRPRSLGTKKKIGEITAPVREAEDDEIEVSPAEVADEVEVTAEVDSVAETAAVETPESVEAPAADVAKPVAKKAVRSQGTSCPT